MDAESTSSETLLETWSTVAPQNVKEDPMLMFVRYKIIFDVFSYLHIIVMVLGLATNIVNISIFLKIGLKDSINLCFFVLSCSDLVSLVIMVAGNYFSKYHEGYIFHLRVDGLSVSILLMYYYLIFYDTSQVIVTYIALQKCCCVVFPFRFRDMFTPRKSAIVLMCITLCCIATYLPICVSQGMQLQRNPVDNSSVFVYWQNDMRLAYLRISNYTNVLFLTTACHVTVAVCLYFLISSLNASSRWRSSMAQSTQNQKSSRPSDNGTAPSLKGNYPENNARSENDKGSNQTFAETTTKPKPVTKSKEAQVLQSTTFVSVIFILCNTPKVMVAYANLFEPELNPRGQYRFVYGVCIHFRNLLEFCNASFNMFVYLTFNTRFRQEALSFLRFYRKLDNC